MNTCMDTIQGTTLLLSGHGHAGFSLIVLRNETLTIILILSVLYIRVVISTPILVNNPTSYYR